MAEAPSAKDLEAKKAGMKKVETKEAHGPSAAELKPFADLYTKHGGDAKKAAGDLKLTLKDGAKFKDANDFAKQALAGTCFKE
mmetsp:Transcript_10357/g.10321  ORF Transcript_10357/g.10321 Transcript_10357/m.10321 type:complete len:83 (+) Transcript_10357:39-287(+)